MGLVDYQSIIFLKVDDKEYPNMNEKIREALLPFPECKIVHINMQNFLWGSNIWVTIETVEE